MKKPNKYKMIIVILINKMDQSSKTFLINIQKSI